MRKHSAYPTYTCRAGIAGILLSATACTTTLRVDEQLPSAPLFFKLDVSVGTFMTSAARTAQVRNPLIQADVGRISAARFEQAFASMFTRTTSLPSWPPWRDAVPAGLNGVIELETVEASLEMGDDLNKPDVVSVAYEVCLFETDGSQVKCWQTDSSQQNQRKPFQLDFQEYISAQFEYVIRDAIAKFLVSAESDPVLLKWAEQQ